MPLILTQRVNSGYCRQGAERQFPLDRPALEVGVLAVLAGVGKGAGYFVLLGPNQQFAQ
jgi:hypothetical protein